MTPRAAYFVEILKSIGSPLIANAMNGGAKTDEDLAEAVASHLSEAVKTGISLSTLIDVGPVDETDDSIRLAMTALATKLGQQTDKNDYKDAVKAALSFSDNFTPAALNTQRLQDLAAKGQSVDLNQIHVQYLHAFLPIIAAVQTNPLGHSDPEKFVGDIASRLTIHAGKIANTFTDSDDELEVKRVSIGVLEALSNVYVACHNSLDKDKTADDVWSVFNARLSLLKTLGDVIVKGEVRAKDQSSIQETEQAQNLDPKPEPVKLPEDNGPNPMGMFAKKKPDEDKSADTSEPETERPELDTPSDDSSTNDSADDSSGGSNPMSFF